MAEVAQLVRASVCGTECREFESLLPPHIETHSLRFGGFFYADSSWVNKARTKIVF